jgi:hypothetical protein
MLFARLLRPFMTIGTLRIVDAGGLVHTIKGHDHGPDVTMRLHNRSVERKLLWRPAMAVGEAYMAGSLTVDGGDVYPLLDLINRNTFRVGYNPLSRLHHALTWPVRLMSGSNSLKRARRNAAHTYDLDAEFYRLFLDKHMQYTCAYFPKRGIPLDDAQEEKMLHLAAKLLLKPGVKVLDIGCGWGNLAAFLAGLENLSAVGLTLSQEQLRDAERLVREKGVASFAAPNMERWFTKGFLERAPEAVAPIQAMFAATPLAGYLACGEAVRDMDHRALLPRIKAPTLVIAGRHDPATPLEANEYIKDNIPGAQLAVLDAAHMSNVEQRDAYTAAVLGFLRAR